MDNMNYNKCPPIGCEPAWAAADIRIIDLCEAIIRQVNAPEYSPNYHMVKIWAEEIVMQADIVNHYREKIKEAIGK